MRFSITLSFFFYSLVSLADPYTLYRDHDKYGMKDASGNVVIPAAFDALGWSDGSFSVVSGVTGYKLDGRWGLMNLKKEFLSKADYESLTYPGGDRVIGIKKISSVQFGSGCLNLKGEVVIPFRYDEIKIYGVRAVVFVHDRTRYRFGLIDLDGAELIPLQYSSIRPVGPQRYIVGNDDQKFALFSDQGKPLTKFVIDSISPMRQQISIVYQNAKQGLLNREGEMICEPQFREIKIDPDGSVFGRLPEMWRVLTGENREVRSVEADQLIPMGSGLYHIVRGRRHGIVNSSFEPVLSLDYDYLGTSENEKILAGRQGKFGMIRLNGLEVLPIEFDSVVAGGRLARVRKANSKLQWALYDTLGFQKTKKDFDFIGPFNGNFFPALKNGFWGGLDRYGELTIQCVFDSIIQTLGKNMVVRFRGEYGIMSTEEKWIVSPQSNRITLRTEDRYTIKTGNNVFLKDFEGNDIYFTENAVAFGPDMITEVSGDGSWKTIDYMGRIVERTPPVQIANVEKIFPESEGLRGFLRDGKYGFVDSRGRLRISNRYDAIGMFSEGLAAVKILGKWGYINFSEGIEVQPAFQEAHPFKQGIALVKRDAMVGIIDKTGRLIIPARYDSIVRVSADHFMLYSRGYCGLSDKAGQILLDTQYDQVDYLGNGYCLIKRNGHYGLLTLQGLSTIPLIYSELVFDKNKNEYLGRQSSDWKKLKTE